ncbi:MAG: hypothetical protein IKP69_05435, partial [Oscillospiraceae bacterium]|nr:hypothetical protein [Oscillospiraceae bacterium]
DSVKEILEKIFAVDFICLIKEVLISDVYFITLNPENTTYYYEQDDEYAVVCNQEEADYGIRYFEPPIFIENGDELLNQYLAVFCQEKAVKYDENTFSAFLPQKLIQRHYFIKQMKSPGFAALFGEYFVEQYSMRQVAYVVIPLIGKFVSELKKSLYDIAVVAGDVLTKKEFDSHVKQLEKYLESDALDKAVQEWNTAYRRQKKYELQRKRRSVQGDITINPDDRLMGLMKYSEENGNLFSNLKGVLEEYLYCLKELC